MTEIVRALAAALHRHPELNARWAEGAHGVEAIERVRIGLAVAVPAVLVVRSLDGPPISRPPTPTSTSSRWSSARTGTVDSGDVDGITFTVSNLGGFGVDSFDAMITPPRAGTLSVGRVVGRPVVIDGRVRSRPQVDVGLTVDHRVSDGADAARLLGTSADALEGQLEPRP